MASTDSFANSLLQATLEALRVQAPFSDMAEADLAWLVERLSVVYFSQDMTLLEASGQPPDHLFIVKQGIVEAEAPRKAGTRLLQLTSGEMFPLGALLAGRAAANRYIAASDVFCYRLAAADFDALLSRSGIFSDFCTRRIASLLEQSQRAVQSEYALAQDDENAFSRPVRSLVRQAPLSVNPGTPLAEALAAMDRLRVGSIVVCDDAAHPVGILTLKDVLQRVTLAGIPLTTPIAAMMSVDPVALEGAAPVSDALLLMARRGIHHLPLVESGRLIGVISEKDVFALRRLSMQGITGAIARAEDPAALPVLAQDIGALAHNLLAQGMDAENLTAVVSSLNDGLTQRVIALESRAASLPDVQWCWLALGSEGRMEQTLATDQDNALIYQSATEAERAVLLAFAGRVNQRLAECGFPLCKGGIMASNPKWCLSVAEWRATFANWIHRSDAPALLHASIFFDFRPLYGAHELSGELREWLNGSIKDNRLFLKRMVENALANRPPLGLVRDFVVASGGAQAHTLDLKINGITPFVDAARIFALYAGVGETSTAARLRGAARAWKMPTDEMEAWVAAFHFIQLLRLRHQHLAQTRGEAVGNRIDPEQLNALDRRILKEAFRQARKLQAVMSRYFEY
jgi:CBS domain-containing protein